MRIAHPVWKAFAGLTLALALALLTAGCAREDGSKIIGQWRAERFQVMSLKVPIGPELSISRDTLKAGEEIAVPIGGISQAGSEITLDLPMSFGLTFHLEGDDRMYVDLPFVERIYYQRVPALAMAQAAPVVAAAPVAVAHRPAPVVTPVAAPAPDPVPAPAAASVYASALGAARSGDHDAAVRLLHRAFEEKEVRPAEVQGAPEWVALRDDVRFQVLVARYGDQ